MSDAPRSAQLAGLAELGDFDEIIDVRSPAEFALDHIPGAINLPVLDNEERSRVGTLYTQVSPFEARRLGAALVSRNIARHLLETLHDRPRAWRPLVYCWRGGQRSGAMTIILGQIGWGARRLDGGYRAFRRQVLAELESLPPTQRWIVLHGPTGSGKTALLRALARQGAQVLDLEALARHRGSVLGGEELVGKGAGDAPAPDDAPPLAGQGVADPQPGQKAFETALWDALRRFVPGRPVFVEAESRRIGRLSLPEGVFSRLGRSERLRLDVPVEERVRFLVHDYAGALGRPRVLRAQLLRLAPLHGNERIGRWLELVDAERWDELAHELIVDHYDAAYRRGVETVLRRAGASPDAPGAIDAAEATRNVVQIERLDEAALDTTAGALLERFDPHRT